MVMVYDAIWGFKEDILELRKSFRERAMALLSQPLGRPLHKYKGRSVFDEKKVLLVGEDKDSKESFRLVIPREEILDVYLGWDDVLRRWRDTRAWIRPLKVVFKDLGKTKFLYIYAKKAGTTVYGNENERLFETIKGINESL